VNDEHYNEIHGILFKPARTQSIDFVENVVDWILRCRKEEGGIPIFKTGFAKRPFKDDDTYYVLGICWLGTDIIQSQWFKNVPKSDFKHMRENHDDYIYILKKYGSPKDLTEAIKAEVVV